MHYSLTGETGYIAEKIGSGWWRVALESSLFAKGPLEVELIPLLFIQ